MEAYRIVEERLDIQKEMAAALFSPALYDRFLAVEHIKRANPNAPIAIDEAGIVYFDIQGKQEIEETKPQSSIQVTIDAGSVLAASFIISMFAFALVFGGVILYCLLDTIF